MTATSSKVVSGKSHAELRTDLAREAVEEISSQLRRLLADVLVLYLKTKNFHWHMTGRHFPDYHLLLDEQKESASTGGSKE